MIQNHIKTFKNLPNKDREAGCFFTDRNPVAWPTKKHPIFLRKYRFSPLGAVGTKDRIFDSWNPRTYLNTYFKGNEEKEPTIRFIVEEARRIPGELDAMDIGTGPTACYWMTLAPHISGVYLTDFLDSNLQELRKWVTNQPDCFDWTDYTKFILQYEGLSDVTEKDILERDAISRAKVKGYLSCDISLPDPLGIQHRRQYDLVTSFYCADSITNQKQLWRQYMENIFSLLRPGGFFMGGALRACKHYPVGNMMFPSAQVNEQDFEILMKACNFDMSTVRIEVEEEGFPKEEMIRNCVQTEYNYETLIFVSGFVKS